MRGQLFFVDKSAFGDSRRSRQSSNAAALAGRLSRAMLVEGDRNRAELWRAAAVVLTVREELQRRADGIQR